MDALCPMAQTAAEGDRLWEWLLVNFLHGCYWASGAMVLCTNVVVFFCFG